MRRLALLLLITGCHAAPSVGTSAIPPATSAGARSDVTPEALEAAIHARANTARAEQGLAALAADPALAAVARRHSADLARRGVVEHVTPDGGDPNTRAARDGLTCRISVSETQSRAGFLENLFQGGLYSRRVVTARGGVETTDTAWLTTDAIATQAVDGWLASPTHRVNLLDAHVRREGIGVAVAADERVYITQMLC